MCKSRTRVLGKVAGRRGLPERALADLQQLFELVGVRTIRETAVLLLLQIRVSGFPRPSHLLVGGRRRRRRRPGHVHVRQVQLRLGVRRIVGGRHRGRPAESGGDGPRKSELRKREIARFTRTTGHAIRDRQVRITSTTAAAAAAGGVDDKGLLSIR